MKTKKNNAPGKDMNTLLPGLTKCPDCGVDPGVTHLPNCDIEKCSYCGGQCLQCGGCPDENGKMRHDVAFARWTGLYPGVAECRAMNMFAKWPGKDGKWEKCGADDPKGTEDLNTFFAEGYNKVFFIKPTQENEREL